MREAFHQAMRDNPHDAAIRLVYADWLDENGHPHEATHHRIIGTGLQRGSEPYRNYATLEVNNAPGINDPSLIDIGPLRTVFRGKNRLMSPLEASRAATRAGAGLMTQYNFSSVRAARQAEYNAEREARAGDYHSKRFNGRDDLAREAASGHYRGAAISHEMSANYHLQAANDLETRGTGRHRQALARLHRRAALAHLYAAHTHRQALGEV